MPCVPIGPITRSSCVKLTIFYTNMIVHFLHHDLNPSEQVQWDEFSAYTVCAGSFSSLTYNLIWMLKVTHVKEVSCHAAAMTLFVPVRPLAARAEQVTREAAVVAVLIGTFTGHMARGAT